MNIVGKKYPTALDENKANRVRLFTANISLSKNHKLGNRFAVHVVKQNPKEQIKVPSKKK
jgi:hypothetical protein